MSKLILNSYAKLNLYLEVLNKRKDNYHNLRTIFERISLCDKIILKSHPDKEIKIISNSSDIPRDNSNLAFRSAKLLQDSLHINQGVEIKIIKCIPVGSGLGGGSSNAASVLLGLNKLWKLNLSRSKLVSFAQKIGSDVPFFIYNCSFAQGIARGDKIKPLKALDKVRLWHILVVPKISVSTSMTYKRWDEFFRLENHQRLELTIPKYNAKILYLALRKKDLHLLAKTLFNSLEQVTGQLYPQVRIIKERLKILGLKTILMSGSGPAIFGIVSSKKEAISTFEQLKKQGSSWRVFVTRTL